MVGMASKDQRSKQQQEMDTGRWKPFLYLLTGVLVSVLGQQVTRAKMFMFHAHILPAVKFLSTFVVNSIIATDTKVNRGRGNTASVKQKRLMVGMGLLDTTAYVLFCLGFGYCGADATAVMLPAMGQILTSFFSLALLKKDVPRRRQIAVCIVFAGVLTKAWDAEKGRRALGLFTSDEKQFRLGVLYLLGASLCYSLLGVLYEFLVMSGSREFPVPAHAHIMVYSSLIGSVASVIFQVLYVVPRWEELVRQPLAASGVSPLGCILWLMAFAMSYQIHSYAQGLTFQSDGALGVQLVNAVRGSVTNVVASLVFCRDAVSICLSYASMFSGVLTATGGVLWTLTGHAPKHKEKTQ